MIFKVWGKHRILGRRPQTLEPRKDRRSLTGIDPSLKQKALDRAAILQAYHLKLGIPRKSKTKTEAMRNFLREYNSGILSPDGIAKPIPYISRATLYNWDRLHRNGGIIALVPRYRTKESTGRITFRPLANPIEMKFPGPPKRNGKREFLERIKRRWKGPPLECPIRLTIFYSMPVPKKTRMKKRMEMLRGQILHTGKPNLDALNAFVVDCMTGIVFKDHSQIVRFHSEKSFGWWPQTRVLLQALKG